MLYKQFFIRVITAIVVLLTINMNVQAQVSGLINRAKNATGKKQKTEQTLKQEKEKPKYVLTDSVYAMPQIYTKGNDMSDLSEDIKEALECAKFRFSGESGTIPGEAKPFKVDTAFFVSTGWDVRKSNSYPYEVKYRQRIVALLTNVEGRWLMRLWWFEQDADGKGGFKRACRFSPCDGSSTQEPIRVQAGDYFINYDLQRDANRIGRWVNFK